MPIDFIPATIGVVFVLLWAYIGRIMICTPGEKVVWGPEFRPDSRVGTGQRPTISKVGIRVDQPHPGGMPARKPKAGSGKSVVLPRL